MIENFGPNTWVKCRGCFRRIPFTKADVTAESDGQRVVTVQCNHPICSLYRRAVQYYEIALEIRA